MAFRDYAEFIGRFAQFAEERSIPWAIIGSRAMMAHAAKAGIPPRPGREAHDLDIIIFLPRIYDNAFRTFLESRSVWVYEIDGSGAIYSWCEDKSQVDFFVKPNTFEIDRAEWGEVLGGPYRIVCKEDMLKALSWWVEGSKDPKHITHCDMHKYAEDFAWITSWPTPAFEGDAPVPNLSCTGRNGQTRTYQYTFTQGLSAAPEWDFRVWSIPPPASGEFFSFSVRELDAQTVRVIAMAHNNEPAYIAMGIPEAIILEAAAVLHRRVTSSPTAGGAGIWRTPEATKVWERLRAAGRATYNSATDIYSTH
jgi:hypothetical protein